MNNQPEEVREPVSSEQAAEAGPVLLEMLKHYEEIAQEAVSMGLKVAEGSVASASGMLKTLSGTVGVKVAEVSLAGASDILCQVGKSLGRIRESLVHDTKTS